MAAGPAEVVYIDPDGSIHLKWQGNVVICRTHDARPALSYHSIVVLRMFNTAEAATPLNTVLT